MRDSKRFMKVDVNLTSRNAFYWLLTQDKLVRFCEYKFNTKL